jgi:hypothetical protein
MRVSYNEENYTNFLNGESSLLSRISSAISVLGSCFVVRFEITLSIEFIAHTNKAFHMEVRRLLRWSFLSIVELYQY